MRKFETAMLQSMAELEVFIQLAKAENVRSFLEIGSKHGGSLWHIAKSLPEGSRVVSVDLPRADGSFKESQPHLEECVAELKAQGYDAHLFLGDSTDKALVEEVRKLGPFDLCFIDANHTVPYIKKDWANYGAMARIVAFHDIGWIARPHKKGKSPVEVPIVWKELRKKYRHREICYCPRDNGIGVLWRF